MKVALVMPVYNRREITLQGLRSLSRIDREGLDVRIFVVDDKSPDGTADAVAEMFPEVSVIHGTGRLHYAAGTNRGIEAAMDWDPDYVVTMNDDAVFHDQFLQRLVHTARENPRSIVGGLLLLWNEPHRVFQVGLEWHTLSGGWHVPEDLTAFTVPREAFEVETIVGNCVLIPAAAIRENGVLDEANFPHGWGDAQYFVRLRKAGWRLLVQPRSYIWCEPNTYPPPLKTLPVTEITRVLFRDERHPANLKRQFVARWESSPDRMRAFAAFTVHCLGLGSMAAREIIRKMLTRSQVVRRSH